jgi:hypothetical protein
MRLDFLIGWHLCFGWDCDLEIAMVIASDSVIDSRSGSHFAMGSGSGCCSYWETVFQQRS